MFYNLTLTGLSVAVAVVVGTIEIGGLMGSPVDTNLLGFVIVAMFVATWVIALLIWRLGRIEERWSANLQDPGPRSRSS